MIGIISGSDLKDMQDKVKTDSLVYAGSDGFDIEESEGLYLTGSQNVISCNTLAF